MNLLREFPSKIEIKVRIVRPFLRLTYLHIELLKLTGAQ